MQLNYETLSQIEAKWNINDTGWRRPGHIAACTDIMILTKEIRNLKREVFKMKSLAQEIQVE